MSNEPIIIVLRNGFQFKGKLISKDEQFITILDFRTNAKQSIAVDSIERIQEAQN